MQDLAAPGRRSFCGPRVGAAEANGHFSVADDGPMAVRFVRQGPARRSLYWAIGSRPRCGRDTDIAKKPVTNSGRPWTCLPDGYTNQAGFADRSAHNVRLAGMAQSICSGSTQWWCGRTLPDGARDDNRRSMPGVQSVAREAAPMRFLAAGTVAVDSSGTIWAGDRGGAGTSHARVRKRHPNVPARLLRHANRLRSLPVIHLVG